MPFLFLSLPLYSPSDSQSRCQLLWMGLGRRAIMACASVCRRAAVKEIVRVPEVPRKLTFHISLNQVNLVGHRRMGTRPAGTLLPV